VSFALAATIVALKAQDTETLISIWDGVYTPISAAPIADRH
jgi:hypothetical protein